MSASKLDKVHETGLLSRMGGAAQGGSAKTKQEREELDRENQGEQLDDDSAGSSRRSEPARPAADAPTEKRPPSQDKG